MSNRLTKLRRSLVPSQSILQALRTRLENKTANAYWYGVGVVVVSLVGTAFYSYMYILIAQWQFLALAGMIFTLGIAAVIGAIQARKGHTAQGVWTMLLVGQMVVAVSTLFVGGQGMWYATGVILSTLLISSLTMTSAESTRAVIVGIIAGLSALAADEFVNIWQTGTPPLLSYFVIAVVVFLLILYLINLSLFFTTYSLRGKITIGVFSAAIIAIVISTAINSQIYRTSLIGAAKQTLLLAADRTASEIDAYLLTLISDVGSITTESSAGFDFLSLPKQSRAQATDIISQIKDSQQQLGAFELVLLERNGTVALHTTYGDVSQFEPYLGLSATDENLIDASILGGGPFIS
jgi:hypothetical protein